MLGIQQDPQLVAVLGGGEALRVELPDATTVMQVAAEELFVQLEQREVIAVADLGLAGATGPPGPSGQSYTHDQSVPAAVWAIAHGLGFRPGGVRVEDTLGREVVGVVAHPSLNVMTVTFNAAFSGVAYVS